MKTTTRFLLLILVALSTHIYGQVKIGDNPNTIDINSLLELESTNKGFLAPRVALTSITAATPLTAPVPVGMLVYSTGGAVTDGFYVWNGTKWLYLLTSLNQRNNYVLVKSTADLPAPVGGVITLLSNTIYEINGTISVSSKINLNGAWLRGLDAVNDRLIYTSSTGELITGSSGGNIRNLTLSAPQAGARVFNLDAAGANTNFIMMNCYVGNSNNVGSIKNFGGVVYIQTVAFLANTNGITYQNDSSLAIINTLWDKNNSNTYEKLVGNFGVVQKTGGDMLTTSANSVTAFDVSGMTGLKSAELKNVLFSGDGVYKTGTFSSRWEVESSGLDTEKDDVASGNIYVTTAASTVIATINTPYKMAGTTATASLFRVTSPSSNRLTYTGRKTRRFQVTCSMTVQFTGSGNNKFFSFYIAKNGVVLPESKQKVKLINNTDQAYIGLSCTVQMAANDYIEVFVENNTDATDLTAQTFNLAIK